MDTTARYLDGTYLEDNAAWHEEDAAWKARQVAEILSKHHIEPASICDVGCGTGGVLDELGRLTGASTLVGYEIAPHAVEAATQARRDRIEFATANHVSDPRTFDVLLCLDVFEHVEDYYAFLRDLHPKAAVAVFHIPIDLALTTVLRPSPILRSIDKVGHIQHFTPAIALRVLTHAGFEIIDHWHTVPARAQSPAGTRQRLANLSRRAAARVNTDLAARILTGFPLLVLASAGAARADLEAQGT